MEELELLRAQRSRMKERLAFRKSWLEASTADAAPLTNDGGPQRKRDRGNQHPGGSWSWSGAPDGGPPQRPPHAFGAIEGLEQAIAVLLQLPGLSGPVDSAGIYRRLARDSSHVLVDFGGDEVAAMAAIEKALRSLAGGAQPCLELEEFVVGGKPRLMVLGKLQLLQRDHSRLSQRSQNFPHGTSLSSTHGILQMSPFSGRTEESMWAAEDSFRNKVQGAAGKWGLEELLSKKSYKEEQKTKTGTDLLELLQKPTAKESAVAAKFKSKGGSIVIEYCPYLTKEDCVRHLGQYAHCRKVHFRRIIAPHTDANLGDCSFLDTCRHMKTCKYVHYELDNQAGRDALHEAILGHYQRAQYCSEVELGEPQWINCDIRTFKVEVLGQFGVIMADPPWDIHMELPYGTMTDDEMRNMPIPVLQTDGLIFLWVTGRAMELGRECLELWGYHRVEELIWVKINQLQRIIRTGRTGHWLNHSKEHCLVGMKGDPVVNSNIDTDVLVAEVRETSRKPDEMYSMLERISPRTRKLEIFARPHNTHAGWISLGNQLDGVRLVDKGMRDRFKAIYPEVSVKPLEDITLEETRAQASSDQLREALPYFNHDESLSPGTSTYSLVSRNTGGASSRLSFGDEQDTVKGSQLSSNVGLAADKDLLITKSSPSFRRTQSQHPDLLFPSYADDTHIIGPPAEVMAAYPLLVRELDLMGLRVCPSKSVAWSPRGLPANLQLPHGCQTPANGLAILKVPIGTPAHVA
eukprot:SM000046S16435  [mRNA]  locus=s46:794878:800281:+ [translate_table: standard]